MTSASQYPGDRTAPKSTLRLEHVYGYRSANCRSNIHLTDSGELVYFSAAVGIVQNLNAKTNPSQRFFLGHDGDIISSCLHPNKTTIATGQMGKTAQICVWDTQGIMKLESLLQGHTAGVGALNFNGDGEKLASVGIDSDNTIKIWQWRQGKLLATVAGHTERIFDISFLGDRVVTCGVRHIRYWTLLGNTLEFREGDFGKSEAQTLLCIGKFARQEPKEGFDDNDNLCFTGTISGDIIIWKKNKLDRIISPAHSATIYSIDINPNGFLTSSKDGTVAGWTRDFTPTGFSMQIHSLTNDAEEVSVCSVASRNGYCVVGTRDSEIYGFELNGNSIPQPIVQAHHDTNLSALACHPKENVFATGGDDCSLRFWNGDKMSLIKYYPTPSDSAASPPPAIRSLDFSSDGSQIAVGYENGLVEIYKTSLEQKNHEHVEPIFKIHEHTDRIQVLVYSPNDKYLAVGCVDGGFDLYDVQNKFKTLRFKNNNMLGVTSIDWSADEKYVRYTGEHKQQFLVEIPSLEIVSNDNIERIAEWKTITSFQSKTVKGIWNKFADKTDIVTLDVVESDGVIAAGDETGLIKLFRFPSEKRGAHFRKYVGHSSRIAKVVFLHDHSRLITIGSDDRTIIQWKFLSESDSFALLETRRMSVAPVSSRPGLDDVSEVDLIDGVIEDVHTLQTAEHVGAYLDSDSEDSDSDLSGAEIDSDIEKEKQISYDRNLYREDYEKIKKTMKQKLPPGEKRQKQPEEGLTLDYVFGYRAYDCRDNVFCLKNEIVYHVAALGIVLNTEQNVQRCYNCHTDDILCLAVSPDMSLVATGQIGRDPPVHVWDPVSLETRSILKGQHYRGISALGFSRTGKLLASVGLDDYRTIVIWDWKKGEKLAAQRGHNDKIFCLRWNPHDDDRFVTVGVKHIKFWAKAGGGMTSKQGVFGNVAGKQGKQNQMCVVFGKTVNDCITGGGDGCIYIWHIAALTKKIDNAHKGPLFCITAVQEKGYATGGKDGKVILWNPDFSKSIKTYLITNDNLAKNTRGQITEQPTTAIRSVTLTRRIVIGTNGGEICEIEKDGQIRVVAQGHSEGEMWGLATHPKRYEICTASDDKTVRIWSLTERRMLRFAKFAKLLRTCEYSHDGETVAVGTKDGEFMILKESNLSLIKSVQHRNQEVSDIKFSPDGRYLAVGTHDNFVDIYSVETQQRMGICKANSSYITHIDWDKKGKLIKTNSGAKELLFYEAPRGTRVTSIKTTDIENLDWHTWTGVLGLVCEGIWPPATDVTDVNSTHLSTDKTTLATGDDFGLVKLFQWPAKGKAAKFKRYTGHSAHVTRVRWTYDNSYLVSIGGRDVAILLWKHGGHPLRNELSSSLTAKTTVQTVKATPSANAAALPMRQERGVSDDSDNTDSEEEGYDSDVQHDRSMDYNLRILIAHDRAKEEKKEKIKQKTNQKHIRAKVKPSQRKINEELALVKVALKSGLGLGLLNASRPNTTTDADVDHDIKPRGRIVDLVLEHIHGYRGFDCRDNLFYLSDDESIVYPAAGAGIVQHIRNGTQRFYLKHTDDIISMAVHHGPTRDIVASGQIGENPTIHIWDAKTMKTISILSGKHKRGVCSLSFSTSGKFLLSMGVDAPHTVAVWRWEEGVNVACTVASEERIFRALFRPNADNQFVTAGVKHLKFWTVAGNTLVEKKAVIAKTADGKRSAKMQTMLSIAFGKDGRTYTGSMTGSIFIWIKNELQKKVVAHFGPIFSIFSSDNCIVTGAKEKRSLGSTRTLEPVKVWDWEMSQGRTIKFDSSNTDSLCVRAVCRNTKGKILIGLKTSDIIEIDEKTGSQSMSLVFGHGEGQLWALSPHPTEPMFATGSYDRNLVVWSINSKTHVAKRDMGKEIRSISFDIEGNLLAVGFRDGQISLVAFSSENGKLEDRAKTRERNAPILCVRFSPNRKLLVASSENCCIDFFNIEQEKFERTGYVTHIEDPVVQIDWGINSRYIRASTAGYHALIFSAPAGEEIKSHEIIEKIVWNTWTSTIGDDILGIWPKDVKKDHINCAHATSSTIVTGDDHGAVNLFKFPCPEAGAEHKTYYGHSDNVTNVRFVANERYLVSLGGDDCCVFLWKCMTKADGDDDDD